MLDSILMLLHLWLYQHWLLYVHMRDLYSHMRSFYVKDLRSGEFRENDTLRKERIHAEISIWQTYSYCSERLNMKYAETILPPTA